MLCVVGDKVNNIPTWITVGAAIFAVRFVLLEATFERARTKGLTVVFTPVLGIRLLFGFGVPTACYAVSQLVREDGLHGDLIPISVFVCFIVGAIVMWPGTIYLGVQDLTEKKWFGLRVRRIPWTALDYVMNDPGEGFREIVARNGTKIRFTKYHVDPDRFERELAKHYKTPTLQNIDGR